MPKVASKLVSDADGAEIHVGECVTTIWGEKVVVTDWTAPAHPGFTGRVYVKVPGGQVSEYFPGVIKAHIVVG